MNTIEGSDAESHGARTAGRRFAWALPLCLLLAVGCQKSIDDRIAEAKVQQEIGAFRESIPILQAVLDDEPDHPEANLLYGAAQLRTGQAALAIWPLELAGRDPEYADPSDLALGAAYAQLNQYDAAVQAADRVLARSGTDPETRAGALRLRASAHLGAKDSAAAVEDIERILDEMPDDAEAAVLLAQAQLGADQIDEAEATLLGVWNDPAHMATPVAARAGVNLVKLQFYYRDDSAKADEVLEELLQRYPSDSTVLAFVVDFLSRDGRERRAADLLRTALEKDPGDMQLRTRLAEMLTEQKRAEEAEALLVEANELFDSPETWFALSSFLRTQGRFDEAVDAVERCIELVPGQSDVLRFHYANLLADAGRYDQADAVAQEIQSESYRKMSRGRIAYLAGKPAEALRLLDAALRQWPNNAGGRYLAAKAAIALGDVDRAIDELQESVRADILGTDATIELAMIYLSQREPAAAFRTSTLVVNHPEASKGPLLAPALLLTARAQWDMAGNDPSMRATARKQLEALAQLEGQGSVAAVELARFESEVSGPKAAARLLENRPGIDPMAADESALLRALCEYHLEAGQIARALALSEQAVGKHGDSPDHHDLHARVLWHAGRIDEANAAFERALADGDFAPALEGQANLLQLAGDLDGALERFDRASAADPRNPSYPHRAGQILLATGRADEAVERLNEALRRDPVHAHASNDLAWIYAEQGTNLERALGLARRAARAEPTAAVLDTLGWVQYRRGEFEAAAATLERARSLDPESPSVAYRLGLAVLETGDEARARKLFEEALGREAPFPEAEAAKAQLDRMAAVQ